MPRTEADAPTVPASTRPRSKARLWATAGALTAFGAIAAAIAIAMGNSMADSAASLSPAPIDGPRAYGYLKEICAIGPRPAGSAANTKQRAFVARHFEKHGGTIKEQPFTGVDPATGQSVAMVNLIGSWFPDRLDRVLLGVHYDTRPHPDEDTDPVARKGAFLGANDGASGVALLMEIAHHLKDSKTPWGVDLVLFDGEELVYGGGQDQNGEYFLGSKAFARHYVQAQRRKARGTPHYSAAIVLDMVGDKDLFIDKEPNSIEFNPRLVRDVWAVAKALGVSQFRDRVGRAVNDDHLPLFNGGIPAIDVIDFDYPHWHTARDLPENCSAASLEAVGRVVTAWLNKPKPRR